MHLVYGYVRACVHPVSIKFVCICFWMVMRIRQLKIDAPRPCIHPSPQAASVECHPSTRHCPSCRGDSSKQESPVPTSHVHRDPTGTCTGGKFGHMAKPWVLWKTVRGTLTPFRDTSNRIILLRKLHLIWDLKVDGKFTNEGEEWHKPRNMNEVWPSYSL